MPDAPFLACRALTRRYGSKVGIENLDLTVHGGGVVGFLGPNGAGKTTVIRLALGLLAPTSGTVELFGVDARVPAARARVGYMPADPAFYENLSGLDNLDLLAELGRWAMPDRTWAAELLDLSAADLARPVGTYSSGMVQKLGLIQAVQHRPDLVVLDEPANRLDPLAHHQFEAMVRAIADDGRAVFLSSHALAEVEQVCDTVAMVRAGRLLTVASVRELTDAARREVTIRYHGDAPAVLEGLTDVVVSGSVVRGHLQGTSIEALRRIVADDRVADVLVEPGSLEDSFLHLYHEDGEARG